jgi:hypothetical protein
MSAAPCRDRRYQLTVREVLQLRAVQAQYLRIANTPGIRQTARESAWREIARIEGEIRGEQVLA